MNWNYETIKTPAFWIDINGKRLTEQQHNLIEEVTYEDHATGSDICSVTIADPLYEFISNPLFVKQTKFKLTGGYLLKHRVMLEGYISAVDYEFLDDNTPAIILHAMDASHVMDRDEKKRTWNKKSRYQVAASIAKEYGLGFTCKPNAALNKVEETLSQSNQTDMGYLISMAEDAEMIVYVKGNILYMNERNYSVSPQGKLVYRNHPFTLIEFVPRVVQKDLPEEIDEQNIDDKGKTEKGKADDSVPKKQVGSSGQNLSTIQKSKSALIYDGDIKLLK